MIYICDFTFFKPYILQTLYFLDFPSHYSLNFFQASTASQT